MIHLLVLALAALHLQDPAGDAVGDGTLVPPTAPIYANTADFDLQSVTLTSDPKLTVRLELGSLSNAGKLPNGFSSPIIEVYLDTAPGGAQQLLPGSSMAMPPKHGWEVALRATGDEAYAVEAQAQGSPASWPRLPVTVKVQGNTITLRTTLERPDRAQLYALTGIYDPFTQDGWRPLAPTVSPWSFSSPSQQVPVVDLLASNQSAQRREIDSGVLSPYRSPFHGIGWLVLMMLGLIIAAAGLVVRRRVRPPAPVDAAADGSAVPAEGAGPDAISGAPPHAAAERSEASAAAVEGASVGEDPAEGRQADDGEAQNVVTGVVTDVGTDTPTDVAADAPVAVATLDGATDAETDAETDAATDAEVEAEKDAVEREDSEEPGGRRR